MKDSDTIYVRNLGRHSEGHWIAEVSTHGNANATWLRVHRKFGSWLAGGGDNDGFLRDIRFDAAAELQKQVRKLEKAERKDNQVEVTA